MPRTAAACLGADLFREAAWLLAGALLMIAQAACGSGSGPGSGSGSSDGPVDPPAANAPPRIDSATPEGSSLEAEAGGSVTFQVAASDPEGKPLTYEFLLDGRRVSTASSYTFAAGEEGEHDLELRVSDGASGVSRRWTIRVVPDAPHAPVAALTVLPDSGVVPLQATLRGSGSDTDGPIVRYELDADGDGAFELSDTRPPVVVHTFASAGTFHVRLRVMDSDSLTAEVERTVRVVRNQPPHADLSVTPPDGPAPLAARVSGAGTDPENAIARYELDADGDGRYELSAASPIDTTLVFEDYTRPTTLALRVSDAAGASDVAHATVTPRPDVDTAASSLSQDGTGRLLSDGKATRRITVRVVDPTGRLLPNVEVSLTSSRNGGPEGTVDRLEPAQGETDADGRLMTSLRTNSSSLLYGDAVIRAAAAGETLGSSVTVQFTTPVNTFFSTLTCPFGPTHVRSSPSEPRQAVITARVGDAQDHALPGMLVELKTRDASIWPVSPPSGRSDASGRFQATVTSDRAGDNTFVDLYADGYKTSAICVVSFIP